MNLKCVIFYKMDNLLMKMKHFLNVVNIHFIAFRIPDIRLRADSRLAYHLVLIWNFKVAVISYCGTTQRERGSSG